MSIASLIGPGFSGYATLGGIPLLLLPTTAPENENMHKSEGAFHPDPAKATGPLPAKQRRSLVVSLQTLITPKIWPLIKTLTYGWRTLGQVDGLPEVPFTYVVGSREGYQGTAHIDEVTVSVDPSSLMTVGISFTSWVWEEMGNPAALPKTGSPVLNPFDNLYRPVPGWATIVTSSILPSDAIPLRYSLRFTNNWNYQSFLAGYSEAPNPSLITAGRLDASIDLSWLAARKNRPLESGTVAFQMGVTPILGTIHYDRVIREPSRQFNNSGNPDQVIEWQASFFAQGSIPRS